MTALTLGDGMFGSGAPAITWLGQAGFWIDTGAHKVLIDPYLSDALARKYAGKTHDHARMAPPPVAQGDLPRPDVVLVTHAHGDHMDADTLGPLTARFPDLPVVVPRARLSVARKRCGGRLIPVSDGETPEPVPGLRLRVLPAAHETLERDEENCAVFLGFAFEAGGRCIYHSGDCVPFEGLIRMVADLDADVALLPVNGRDAARAAAGIPGNFRLKEAVSLCRAAGIPAMVPHHFGMFAFNTLDEAVIDAAAEGSTGPLIIKPRLGRRLEITG